MPAPGGFVQPNWWGGVPLPQYQPARLAPAAPAAPAVDPNQLALQQAQANMLRGIPANALQMQGYGAMGGTGGAINAAAQPPTGMNWQQYFKSIGW